MYRLFLFLILDSKLANLFGQQDRPFNLNGPDLPLLERQTFHAVNDLRLEKKVATLSWDDVLYRAARDHADYLIQEKKLSHEQRFKDKSTPGKRVKLHGGLAYSRVGENLVSVTSGVVVNLKGQKLSTQSVNSAAMTMAQLWKESPGHYRNILEKGFNASALAIAYEPTSQRVVAVQVFGFTTDRAVFEDQPDRSEELLNRPERKLPFGLKESGNFTRQRLRSIQAFIKLENINGYLIGPYKLGKKAFRGRTSGIAVESIPLSQFDSGAIDYDRVRNRRNGLYALNGNLHEPVYRRTMLKYARRYSPQRLWLDLRIIKIYRKKKVFIYPSDAGPGSNLFLISKKQLTTYITPIGLPAQLLEEPLPSLKFASSINELPVQILKR